ncbi:MAG: ROK family transcriptional regulator [Lentisphaeria bacterium]|nr:ROK family transcriptional regulator [Lentisphaeria bacterium]
MAKGILQNRDFIIDYVRRNEPVSRLRIAREFGMNPSTVGNMVETLLGEGIVVESPGPRGRRVGRPPILLHVNPGAGRFAGVDVYRTRVTAALTDFSGNVLADAAIPLGPQPRREGVLRSVLTALHGLLEADDRGVGLKAIGIGLPGVVDRDAGIARRYDPIRDWRDVPVRQRLAERFGTPVYVDHNSNTVALGEACAGDATAYDHVVTVLLRAGVSMGVVRHRELQPQSPLGAGELGHTVIAVGGRRCWCGARGCLEAYASAWALQRCARRVLAAHPSWEGGAAFAARGGSFDPALICRLAGQGEDRACRLLRPMFRFLGTGIQTVVRLLAPEAVVVSGSFHEAGELLREEVLGVLEQPLRHPVRVPAIIVSSRGDRIGAVGAALLAASMVCNPIHRVP